MAEFYISMTSKEISTQIADMINKYNRWSRIFSADEIMSASAKYFIEVERSRVVGCASFIVEHPTLSKIQHVCVLPEYRRLGLGRKLVTITINHCDTDYIYMSIREDNEPSIRLAESLGFVYVRRDWVIDHWTRILGRRTKNATPTITT